MNPDEFEITTDSQLDEIFGTPVAQSIDKEISYISSHYRAFIERSPFIVLASAGPEGLDCSPRGDPPGFVRVLDEKTVLIPDRRGNNRIDTLRNIVRDRRVSLLFLVPGVGETLRINGEASLTAEPALCDSFAVSGKSPRIIIRVHVNAVYFQCQKALARSRLWCADAQVERSELPTAGQMLQALSKAEFDGEKWDKEYPQHMKRNMY